MCAFRIAEIAQQQKFYVRIRFHAAEGFHAAQHLCRALHIGNQHGQHHQRARIRAHAIQIQL